LARDLRTLGRDSSRRGGGGGRTRSGGSVLERGFGGKRSSLSNRTGHDAPNVAHALRLRRRRHWRLRRNSRGRHGRTRGSDGGGLDRKVRRGTTRRRDDISRRKRARRRCGLGSAAVREVEAYHRQRELGGANSEGRQRLTGALGLRRDPTVGDGEEDMTARGVTETRVRITTTQKTRRRTTGPSSRCWSTSRPRIPAPSAPRPAPSLASPTAAP
jgi:hypothetical protein